MSDFVGSPKNPPPASTLDLVLRRFARVSYHVFVVLVIVVSSSALGYGMAPALWVWRTASAWSESFPALLRFPVFGLALSASFFVFLTLLLIVPIYNGERRVESASWAQRSLRIFS